MLAFLKKLPPYLAAATLALILAIYIYLQHKNFIPAYAEPDLDAYFWLAKRMAHLQPLAVPNNTPLHFQEHMWVLTPSNLITTKFAPGNSLLMVPFYLLFGDNGCFLMPNVLSFLTLIGAYLLFRKWMARIPALIAVVAVLFNPLFLTFAGFIHPHAADLCFITWGLYFLFSHLQKPSIPAAIGAGLTLGYAVTIRHPDALFAIPLLAVFALTVIRRRKTPAPPDPSTLHSSLFSLQSSAFILLAAYSLFPFALLLYDYALFGNPFTTGYALSNEQNGFYYEMFKTNYPIYLEGAFDIAFFLLLPLGILGAITLGPWQARLTRILALIPLFLLYMAYYWFAPKILAYRFLLALLPLFVGCAYALIDQVRANPIAKYLAMILLCSLTIYHDRVEIKKYTTGEAHLGNTTHYLIGNFLAANLQPNAVIFLPGAPMLDPGTYNHYINQREQFDVYPLNLFEQYALNLPSDRSSSLERALRGLVPPRMQPVRRDYLQNFYRTHSNHDLQNLKLEIIQNALDHHTQVAYMIPTYEVDSIENSLTHRFNIKPLKTQSFPIYNPWQNDKIQDETWSLLEITLIEKPPTPPTQPGTAPTIFDP